MRILIVDDSERMRGAIRGFVCGPSDVAFEAADGEAAVAAYRAHRPDWVLMDIMMPGAGGIAATREIVSLFPDARVLVVTSYDDPVLREAAREAGARDYIVKDNLLDLRALLDGRPPVTH
jgi:DNA-binding NarL/FixJ family response regulator